MENCNKLRLFNLFFALMLYTNFIATLGDDFDSNQLYVISSIPSYNMVLDCQNPSEVTIEYYRSAPSQFWRLVPANGNAGYFYIANNRTGLVLDFSDCHGRECFLRLNEYVDGYMGQEWSITSDNTIRNNLKNENLEVRYGNYVPGNPVVIHPDDGLPQQLFELIPKRWLDENNIISSENQQTKA